MQFQHEYRCRAALAAGFAFAGAFAVRAGGPDLGPIQFLPGDDDIAPAIQAQSLPAVAAGGGGYLAVWADHRAALNGQTNAPESGLSGNMIDIYGQRLDAEGNRVGEVIVIANEGRNQTDPSVAWNEEAQAWLVAFEGDQPDWYFDVHTWGVRVAADGTVLDPDPILILEEVDGQAPYDPVVSSDGSNWLVIADQWLGSPPLRTVVGRRLASDGSLIDPQPVHLITSNTLANPDVAFADGVYLIVAQSYANDVVWFQRFDAHLAPLGALTQLAQGQFNQRPFAAASDDRFMVVATNAHRIEPNGTVLDPGSGIPLGGGDTAVYKDVAWTGQHWAVSMRFGFSPLGPAVQRISDSGALLDPDPIFIDSEYETTFTTIAGLNGGAVVVYEGSGSQGGSDDARAGFIDASGNATPGEPISLGLPRQAFVQMIDGPGNENLAVFLSQTHGRNTILSQRITDAGVVLDAEPAIVYDTAFDISSPHVAWNGSVYMVAFNSGAGAVAVRVTAENVAIDTPPIVVDHETTAAAVGAAGENFVVGVIRRINFHEPVQYVQYVRISGSSGLVLDPDPVHVTGGFVREMTADTFGNQAILAWAQYGNHDSSSAYAQAAIIAETGAINGPFRLSVQRGKDVDVAVDEDQALVVWHDDTTIHEDNVEGRFITAAGSMPASEFLISGAPGLQRYAAAGWDGSQYVVAWNDYRHIVSVVQRRADIFAARVTPGGAVLDPGGIEVTDTELPEDLPDVVGGGDNAVIMFCKLNGIDGTPEIQRLAYRVMGEPAQTGTLLDFSFVFGSHVAGNLPALAASDDVYLQGRSQFGFSAQEPNIIDLVTGYNSPLAAPAAMGVTLELRINNPGGNGKLRIKNWSSRAFEEVGTFTTSQSDSVESFSGIDPAMHIRPSDHRVEISTRISVIATFSAAGFDAWFDHQELTVE